MKPEVEDSVHTGPLDCETPKIGVLGLGHVGLPTALGLAELGWDVMGADDDSAKVASLQKGDSPFYEPGLQELLTKHLASGKFRPTEDVSKAVRFASVLFVCVGTPQRENGEADLSQVEAVARLIARNLNGYKLVVEKSTVPVITAQWIKRTVRRYARNGKELPGQGADPALLGFEVASNPEFLQEGQAVQNFLSPDRIVCGVESEKAKEILQTIYRPLNRPLVVTDLNTAEIIKHAANAFLATKVSFINMVADLCETVGADVTQVAHGIGLDPRIGGNFLRAGIGFGGYCLPKDLRAFLHLATEHGVDFSLLEEVERINQRRIDLLLKKVRKALWVLEGKTLGILGLAFKPGTDDIREAPSTHIIPRLLQEGAALQMHDPQAMPNMQHFFPQEKDKLVYCPTPYEAARGAQALLLLTEWEEYRQLDWQRMREEMEVPLLVDGRNLLDPQSMQMAGFEYFSIGR
ncbi:MAG: UDP-glucose/GDP-mannose dehydrogenase family protein [Acidobacteria bacterium]|nr:UDP-glucose/GDP-mannose dehydrogenase family protein [Acidobacteriota bacterium]